MNNAPVQAGDILAGKYRVEKILGAGAMGMVLAATQIALDRRVALKFMMGGGVGRQEHEARFLREARAASKLQSHHAAKVLDVGMLEGGAPYIVMEFLDGKDLAAVLRERGPLPVEEAVSHILQVCEAVAEAHAAGIVHRDIKPANLFLTTGADRAPCVKLVDFGIAKLADSPLDLTGTVQALGSPLYMSPEALNASKDADGRSDIWALGVTLYELLAQVTPFQAPTLMALCMRVSPRARADASAEDRAAADQLYEDAGKLMKASRWAEACPKLEASQRLDPAIGTSLRLAYCYANEGKTASAWSMFHDTEAAARKANDRRADDAAKQAKLLEPKLARLLVEVAPENGSGDIEIWRDGKALDAAVWSTAVPVDPGEHAIEARKPGKQAWQTTITVAATPGTTTVRIPLLVDAPAVASMPPPSPVVAAASPWGGQRIAGLAVGGAGVVAVVVGAVFGIETFQKTSSAKAYCSASEPYCAPMGITLESDAKTSARVSDAAFAIGGAAVAGGLALFFTAPAGGPKASGAVYVEPVVGIGRAGISARGWW